MIRRAPALLVAATLLGSLAGARALAQTGPDGFPTAPHSAEAVPSADAPIQIRGEDLEALLEAQRAKPAPTAQPTPHAQPAPATSAGRVIEVEAPRVENRSPRFLFRDATARDGRSPGPAAGAPAPAAIEALRHSLATKGSR